MARAAAPSPRLLPRPHRLSRSTRTKNADDIEGGTHPSLELEHGGRNDTHTRWGELRAGRNLPSRRKMSLATAD